MPGAVALLRQGKTQDLWQKHCGFIDLSLQEFMTIQRRLLTEQIMLLKKSHLGRDILGALEPVTVEAFQREVPLTTYADYAPYFLEQREDVLPEKPIFWLHTSNKSNRHNYNKWAPLSRAFYLESGSTLFALLTFATCKDRGDIAYKEYNRVFYGLAPLAYISKGWMRRMAEDKLLDFQPPPEKAESMSLEEVLTKGLGMALSQGLDIVYGQPGVLATMGERLSDKLQSHNISRFFSNPAALLRLAEGLFRAMQARRPLLPRDLWSVKGLVASGVEAQGFREKIKELWGRYPLDVYGCAEASVIATQTWDYQTMTFVPNLNFLEFIPESESRKNWLIPSYKPFTLLLDEVQPGQNYELVITNFHGGAFIRYRMGDMVKIVSRRNENLGIDIPQMLFESRLSDRTDLSRPTPLWPPKSL